MAFMNPRFWQQLSHLARTVPYLPWHVLFGPVLPVPAIVVSARGRAEAIHYHWTNATMYAWPPKEPS